MSNKYRSDIDGLRAVAVLSVVIFHLSQDILPGGYLGVDIFFVISGFLITKILWTEANTDRFSLISFYERRLRRIGPALIVTLLVVTAVATLILLPVDLIGYAQSLIATLLFVSNIYFWRDTDYFSRIALEKPLLHTWSLGVEEQFYIIFPILIWACARYAKRGTLFLILILTIASLVSAIVAVRIGAGLPAFYLLPTRAWELGTGAMLVFLSLPVRQTRILEAGAVLGAALVAVSLASLNPDRSIFPTITSVVGAAILIATGANGSTKVSGLLGHRYPVFLGKISFSLYLVHWPIIVFASYFLVRRLAGYEQLIGLAVMITLATASWRFVEQPFRRRSMSVGSLVLYTALGTGGLISAALALLFTDGLPSRLPADAALINAAVGTNYRCAVGDYIQYGASRACAMNLPERKPEDADVVLLGNSHAQMYAPLVADIIAARKLKGLLVPANGCLPMPRFNISTDCVAIAETNIRAVLALPKVKTVILGPYYPTEGVALVDRNGRPAVVQGLPGIIAGLSSSVSLFAAAGKSVMIIGPIAEPGWDIASVLSRSRAFHRPVIEKLDTSYPSFLSRNHDVFADFENRNDVVLIRVDKGQCKAARCAFLIDGQSLFSDDNHLSANALGHFRSAFEDAFDMLHVQKSPSDR